MVKDRRESNRIVETINITDEYSFESDDCSLAVKEIEDDDDMNGRVEDDALKEKNAADVCPGEYAFESDDDCILVFEQAGDNFMNDTTMNGVEDVPSPDGYDVGSDYCFLVVDQGAEVEPQMR